MNILFHGICGRIGKETIRITEEGYRDAKIVCGVDLHAAEGVGDIPCYTSFDRIDRALDVDCIIDFSHHTAIGPLLKYATANRLPVIVATTGHTDEELAAMREASDFVAIFHSGNMSIGINLLIEMCRRASAALGEDFDIEIIEKHHNNKLGKKKSRDLSKCSTICSCKKQSKQYIEQNRYKSNKIYC